VELKVLEVDPIHHRIVLAATGWPKEDGPVAAPTDTITPPSAPSAPDDAGEPSALTPPPEG
jgi:hypothetical protein